MPTLTELQRQQPNYLSRQESQVFGEEVIADSRASLTPSQLVDRKLEARTFHESERPQLKSPRPRPRAK